MQDQMALGIQMWHAQLEPCSLRARRASAFQLVEFGARQRAFHRAPPAAIRSQHVPRQSRLALPTTRMLAQTISSKGDVGLQRLRLSRGCTRRWSNASSSLACVTKRSSSAPCRRSVTRKFGATIASGMPGNPAAPTSSIQHWRPTLATRCTSGTIGQRVEQMMRQHLLPATSDRGQVMHRVPALQQRGIPSQRFRLGRAQAASRAQATPR